MVKWTTANVVQDFKRQSPQNALLITIPGDRKKAAIWHLDESEVGGQTIHLRAVLAQMSCDGVVNRVGGGIQLTECMSSPRRKTS